MAAIQPTESAARRIEDTSDHDTTTSRHIDWERFDKSLMSSNDQQRRGP